MTRVGYSTFVVNNIFIDTSAYRGNTGPTGPTGNTGPDGISGSTGNTGIGVLYIFKTNTDGITVYLNDGSKIDVTGLSGNTFTDFTSINPDVYYSLSGATGIVPNTSFEIRGGVQGLTAYFKSIKWINGLTSKYSGNDLLISGVTIGGGYALGEFGSVLRSRGKTASVFPISIFKYEENGIAGTTIHLATISTSQFHQSSDLNNKNINSLSKTINDYVGNTANISFHQYEVNSQFLNRNNQVTIFSENTKIGKVTGPNKIFRKELIYNFDGNSGVSLSTYIYGSCCFCDGQGKSRCIDYVNPSLCNTLINGTYSSDSCQNRRTGNCRDLARCCFPNKSCQNLDNFTCTRLGGTYFKNQICSGNCP